MDSYYSFFIFAFIEYDLLLLFVTRPLTSSLKKKDSNNKTASTTTKGKFLYLASTEYENLFR